MSVSFNPSMSTDEICVGQNSNLCLTDDLTSIKTSLAGKLSEDDAVEAFATANHTHTGYAAYTHTHSDIVTAIEDLDSGKAESTHTHSQSDITGLVDKLSEIDAAITELQAGDIDTIEPIIIASMHLGKLDNNSGAEVTSSTRICSDPFTIESGKSYWQVNDKGVNMYVLIYDSDEVFLEYMGNYASGAEIEVTNSNAAYMRISSLLGEYDLANEFRIYNVDPSSTGSSGAETIDAYTKTESDARYALTTHTHDGYASTDHTHTGYALSTHTHDGYATTDHTHTGYANSEHTHTAADITGLPSSVDAYSKTESDARYATANHTHSDYADFDHTHTASDITGLPSYVDAYTKTEADARYATANHTHTGYAEADHTHADYALINHTHTGYAEADHTHTAYAPANHTHDGYATVGHIHNDYMTESDALDAFASINHTHTPSAIGAASSNHSHEYLPLSGGTVTGATNFSGGLVRVSGIQTLFYSGTQMVLSSNNCTTRICGSAISATQSIAIDSDRRLKENITPVDENECAEFIDGVKVRTFNYIDGEAPCIGVIAQEVNELNPSMAELFVNEGEDGYFSVKAADLVFPLIATVQKLSKEVAELKARIG